MSSSELQLSVIAPAHDEEANVRPLVEEIVAALAPTCRPFEIIVVDDGSDDRTRDVLRAMLDEEPALRVIAMEGTPPGRGHGQSAAMAAAIRAARGAIVVMLDADLQNDPADIPAIIDRLERDGVDVVQGDRSHARRDTFVRRVSSWVGRTTRRLLLGDTIRDTGCSLRALRIEVARSLPLEFRGMHRFIPLVSRQLGYTVIEVPVRHRPRIAGQAKYGIWNRALPGLIDCFAVRWMRNRRRPVQATPVPPVESRGAAAAEVQINPVSAAPRPPELTP